MSQCNLGFIPDFHVRPHIESHLRVLSSIRGNVDSELFLIPELFYPFSIDSYNNMSILKDRIGSAGYIDSNYTRVLSELEKTWQVFTPSMANLEQAVDKGISLATCSQGPEHALLIDDINFAYAPLFDMALTRKCSKQDISGNKALLEHYRVMLAAYIACYTLTSDFLSITQRNYHSITAYNDYGPMSAARRAADKHRIQYTMLTNSIVSGFDKNRIIIYNNPEINHKRKKHELFNTISGSCHMYAHPSILRFGELEITSKLAGSSLQSYSPVIKSSSSGQLDSVIERIDSKKTLLVLYISSNDEASAINDWLDFYGLSNDECENRYSSQLHWLEDWLSCADQSNIQFILRMHPRIGKDHRGLDRSADYCEWLRLGAEFERNGHIVIQPESDISSYILPYLSDHNVISWSSIGQELALLGFSVSQAFSQPGGILNFPKTSIFLPYTCSIHDITHKLYHKGPKEILDAIIEAAVFYAWFRGMSSYNLEEIDTFETVESKELATELGEMIANGGFLPEERHFKRFTSLSSLNKNSASRYNYPHLHIYVRIMLRHALDVNTLAQNDIYISNRSRDFLAGKINQRLQLLSKVVELLGLVRKP